MANGTDMSRGSRARRFGFRRWQNTARVWTACAGLATAVVAVPGREVQVVKTPRNAWYWSSLVNLHIDNHSRLVGKGHTVDELVEMVRGIPVTMIQVSAFGADGMTTYPTRICPNPAVGDWDTPAVWREVARHLHKRFGIYINTRGLRLYRQHPEWRQLNAQDKPKGRYNGLDVCCRPWPDGKGALEHVFLPLLREITTRYQPDAIWVDGDHARTAVCYCPGCKAAWKIATGQDDPPRTPDAPEWPRWLRFEQERFDAYRRSMAQAIHATAPNCLYTSNHSWRFRSKDPRTPPEWVDTLSGDLSHGAALRLTRLCAMQTAPETHLPHDIMHLINRKGLAPGRVLQEGAVALSSGGAWFLWTAGATIVRPSVQDQAKACAEFVLARRDALGRTSSINPVAVLLSETSWADVRLDGHDATRYDVRAVEKAALAFEDAGFGVDMPNEELFREGPGQYGLVVIVNQCRLDPRTMAKLRQFVESGGTLLIAGTALLPSSDAEGGPTPAWTGVRRHGAASTEKALPSLDLGGFQGIVRPAFRVDVAGASVAARFSDGNPALVRRSMGRGAVAYLNVCAFSDLDSARLLVAAAKTLGFGPTLAITGPARRAHWMFSLRAQAADRSVLHVCNLTATVQGRRIPPAATDSIDPVASVPEMGLELAWPKPPRRVRAVPVGTTVESRWHEGRLALRLKLVGIHAAVIIEGERSTPVRCLPASVPMAEGWAVEQPHAFDFEVWPVGQPVPDWIAATRADRHTSVVVSKDTAASGEKCLKFQDSPKASRAFMPYLFFRPRNLTGGTVDLRFALRLEAGADVLVELREVENARKFPVGPSLRFVAGRGVLVGAGRGKPVADAPTGEWRTVRIQCPLNGTGTYELTITDAKGKEQVFRGLPCRSPHAFRRCGWIGFCSVSQSASVFYLDDVRIDR